MNKQLLSISALDQIEKKLGSIESTLQQIRREKSYKPFGLLTTQEAAKALQITTRTLQSLRDSGQISYVQCGRIVRYKPEDIQAYIDEYYVRSNYEGTKK